MKELSYDELIIRVRKNDEEAFELLFLMLENYAKRLGKKMVTILRLIDHSVDELVLLSKNLTLETISGYEFDKSLYFAYWKLVITRRLKDIQIMHDKENKIEYEKISLDEFLYNYRIYDKEQVVVQDSYSKKEMYSENINRVDFKFGKKTAKILSLWASGYTYAEIASKIGVSQSAVNYEISKALKYLKGIVLNK